MYISQISLNYLLILSLENELLLEYGLKLEERVFVIGSNC